MKYTLSILASFTITLSVGILVAHAQDYAPLAPLPGTYTGAAGAEVTNLSLYLSGAIKLLITLGASLAILMTIIAGTQYVAAGISPDAKSDAKEKIANAFIGLALMLTSYLILNSINPKLVQFNLMLEPVTPSAITTQTAVTGCADFTPLAPLTGAALSMEGGTNVLWTNTSDPNVQRNLSKLKSEVDKLNTALSSRGASATVNSAWRPIQYQSHLYEIFKKWKTDGLENNTNPDCAQIKKTIGDEYRAHGLGSAVSAPSNTAPHVRGVGVDLKLTGIADSGINAFMSSRGIDLTWQAISGDEVHYNLKNPPYTGAATN